jgi:hypothetical protein
MIVQNGHSLQTKCELRKWKDVIWDFPILLLDYHFFMGHVTSSSQGLSNGLSSTRGKSLGTRLRKGLVTAHGLLRIAQQVTRDIHPPSPDIKFQNGGNKLFLFARENGCVVKFVFKTFIVSTRIIKVS